MAETNTVGTEQTKRLDDIMAHASDTPVRKQFPMQLAEKAIDREQRTVKFVITTGGVDRDNDTIDPMGWDVSNFLKSPGVLWAHDYSQPPVAKAITLIASAQGLESVAQFPPKGMYPFADTVFDLIEFGALNATSVGFRPTSAEQSKERDGGIDFRKQELLEYSIVPVPANPQALIVARSKGINIAPMMAWAKALLVGKDNADGANGSLECPQCHVGSASYDGKFCRACGYTGQPTASADQISIALKLDGKQIADAVVGELIGRKDDGDSETCSMCGGKMLNGVCVACGGKSARPMSQRIRAALAKPKAYGDMPPSACPACGGQLADAVCQACGWQTPDANPMTHPVQTSLSTNGSVLAFVEKGWQVYKHVNDDPIRWNRSLSKAFDVAAEPMEACSLEVSWVSRYLETPIQQLSVESFFVPAARVGSFLSAYDEGLSAWTVDALRSISTTGREMPPEHETIQLNSTNARSFMVSGIRFLRRADNAKIVGKIDRHWSGLYVTHYVRHEQVEVRYQWVGRVHQRAGQINFLKGEAFTLSGEFLDRGNLDWPDLFLDPSKEAVLRRTVERINTLGADMESRGLMEMGPPGTGKTLSGRVMLRQAPEATFIWVSARDFYRSGSYGAFTYAFDLATECAPSIIFFEDVDNWIDSTTIDLLKTEMDGLKRRKGVQTILTTNFPELIPDALIDRPGRFHDLLELSLPTEVVRMRMLRAWLPEAGEKAAAAMAKETDGFSGAHLRELVNFARTLQSEETITADGALAKALAKLREQRELVDALRRGHDYRPSRQVRMAVGHAKELVAKRGRVLSAANESRLRQAQDHLGAVLDKLNQQPPAQEPNDGDGDEKAILMLRDENDSVLMLSDDKDEIVVRIVDDRIATSDEVRAAVEQEVRSALEGLGPLVREQTLVTLARRRGRVD